VTPKLFTIQNVFNVKQVLQIALYVNKLLFFKTIVDLVHQKFVLNVIQQLWLMVTAKIVTSPFQNVIIVQN